MIPALCIYQEVQRLSATPHCSEATSLFRGGVLSALRREEVLGTVVIGPSVIEMFICSLVLSASVQNTRRIEGVIVESRGAVGL
jgi:hypothetical protein